MRTVGRLLRSFGAFWWDFVVGEDVGLAIAVVIGLGAVAVLHAAHAPAWWILPVVWVVGLVWSLARAASREA